MKRKKKLIAGWTKIRKITKTVFKTGMRQGIDPWNILLRLFNPEDLSITRPPDFGFWCLEEAIASTDDRYAEFFLRIVVTSIKNHGYDKGISLGIVEEKASRHPRS